LTPLGQDCWQVIIRFGLLDDPDIPKALQQISGAQWSYDPMTISYFLSRDIVVPTIGGPSAEKWPSGARNCLLKCTAVPVGLLTF
jgi:KUP system potassium uptake protein